MGGGSGGAGVRGVISKRWAISKGIFWGWVRSGCLVRELGVFEFCVIVIAESCLSRVVLFVCLVCHRFCCFCGCGGGGLL